MKPNGDFERNDLFFIVKSILGIFLVFVVIGLGYGAYTALDEAGWITHNHDTPVWIEGDWMVGEYRTCQLMTTTPIAGTVLSQEARAELPRLLCGSKELDSVAGSIVEFQNIVPDVTVAQWDRGDWSAFDSYFHVLPVRYNGRIKRPEKLYVSWRCQRNGSSILSSAGIVCNALN